MKEFTLQAADGFPLSCALAEADPGGISAAGTGSPPTGPDPGMAGDAPHLCETASAEGIRGIVQIVHGAKENKTRYYDLAAFLSRAGYHVILSDLRGSGGSVDDRYPPGCMGDWQTMVSDLHCVSTYALDRLRADGTERTNRASRSEQTDRAYCPDLAAGTSAGAGLPLCMLAHSFGSVLARLYLRNHDSLLSGLIMTGTVRYIPATVFAAPAAGLISRLAGLHGHFPLLMRLGDPVSDFTDLRFCNASVAADWAAIRQLGRQALFSAGNPSLPILSLTGAEDPVAGGPRGIDRTLSLLRRAGYGSLTSLIYPGRGHSLIHEAGALVRKDIADFLAASGSVQIKRQDDPD